MSYVEYMTSGKEMSVVTGAEELYHDHLKFRSDHHDAKVREIMDRELPEVKAPAPRPMQGHMFDFNLTYRGLACWMESAKAINGSMKKPYWFSIHLTS